MIRRLLESCMILLLVIGGFLAWSTGRERARLQAHLDRLIETAGDFPIGDPAKAHIQAIPTGEPLHYAWRLYTPPGFVMEYNNANGFGVGAPMTNAEHFIIRIRIREIDGRLQVFELLPHGSVGMTLGDKTTADLIRGNEPKVAVEQFASDRLETFSRGDSIRLLQLTLPPELQTEAKRTLSPSERASKIPVLFAFDLGPKKPVSPTLSTPEN